MSDFDNLIDAVAAASLPPAPTARVSPVPGLVAHVDGDYMAYFAAGKDTMHHAQCRNNILARCRKLQRVTGATKVIMHLTCGGSDKGGRFLIAEFQPYQKQRKGSKKPLNWQAARDAMTDHDGSAFIPKIWRDREADDGMAYWSDIPRSRGDALDIHVIHAADKDMRMFAGLHVNWKTWHHTLVPHGAFEVIGDDGLLYGHKWFWQQMLEGDSADAIPGLPGCGKTTAPKLLAHTTDNTTAYAAVETAYKARMGEHWQTHMVEQAALLWMRQSRTADVLDFLSLGVFPHSVQEAAWIMADRLRDKRRALEALKE